MFCPKCGTKAIEGTKFCRSCGSDLEVVSAALTGKLVAPNRKDLKKARKEDEWENTNDPDKLWSSFIRNSMVGLAFIAIALFLTFTNTIGGSVWGFWLLIPGAGSLGGGISSYLKIKRIERTRAEFQSLATMRNAAPMFPNQPNAALPPNSTNFADLYTPPPRNTGELVMPPASVTEGTTRHLSHQTESPMAFSQNAPNEE
ncbi:MAG: zinc-ribbon domain-containing protein [Pyrinomonadaceae bacterium]